MLEYERAILSPRLHTVNTGVKVVKLIRAVQASEWIVIPSQVYFRVCVALVAENPP
jgi:hypothetical protein